MENMATKRTLEFSIHAAVATQRLWCNLLLMALAPQSHTREMISFPCNPITVLGKGVRNNREKGKYSPEL